MAREQGLTEDQADAIEDGYADSCLGPRDVAALRLTDALIGDPRTLTPALRAALAEQFDTPQTVELALGVALFMALSKVLITLGLEPERMPVTVLPTPGT